MKSLRRLPVIIQQSSLFQAFRRAVMLLGAGALMAAAGCARSIPPIEPTTSIAPSTTPPTPLPLPPTVLAATVSPLPVPQAPLAGINSLLIIAAIAGVVSIVLIILLTAHKK